MGATKGAPGVPAEAKNEGKVGAGAPNDGRLNEGSTRLPVVRFEGAKGSAE